MVKLIIFDVDGTLVDSETMCLLAFTKVIPELDLSVEELSARYRGRKLADVLSDIEALLGIQLSKDIVGDYRDAYTALVREGLQAYPHIDAFLRAAPAPFCLASNAPLPKIQLNLDASGLANFFPHSHRFSAYEVNAWKPSPVLFQTAAQNMGVAIQDCLVIEDSATGLAAAKAAGMRVMQFREPGAKALAENWFDDYRDLPARIAAL